jgi:hypothetical protein
MRLRLSQLAIVAALLPGAPATAGLILHLVQSTDSNNRHSHTEVDVSAEGDGLRADYTASVGPLTPVGSYVLFPDERTFILVNPAKRTYTTSRRRPHTWIDTPFCPEHVVVEKKIDEAGPVMLGLPTQHVVYVVSYQVKPSIAPSEPVYDYHEKHEIWATKALADRLAAAPVLEKAGSGLAHLRGESGGSEPKEITDAIASYGFILEANFTQESKLIGPLGQRGPTTNTRSFVVTAIRAENLQADQFEVPKGYLQVRRVPWSLTGIPWILTDLGKDADICRDPEPPLHAL